MAYYVEDLYRECFYDKGHTHIEQCALYWKRWVDFKNILNRPPGLVFKICIQ